MPTRGGWQMDGPSHAARPQTDCRRASLEASSNRRNLPRTSIAMPIQASAAAESFQGRSRTARRMGITTWPRRSRLWPCPFLSNEWNFRSRPVVGIVDSRRNLPAVAHGQLSAGAILTEPNLTLAESARSMHVTHRPSLARAPKPARSPANRWPQGLEVAVSGSSSLDQLHAIQ